MVCLLSILIGRSADFNSYYHYWLCDLVALDMWFNVKDEIEKGRDQDARTQGLLKKRERERAEEGEGRGPCAFKERMGTGLRTLNT